MVRVLHRVLFRIEDDLPVLVLSGFTPDYLYIHMRF
jgi:hypothetical protein